MLAEFGPVSATQRSSTDMPVWAAGSQPQVWERCSDDLSEVDPAGQRPSKKLMEQLVGGGLPAPVDEAVQSDRDLLAAAVGELLAMLPASQSGGGP